MLSKASLYFDFFLIIRTVIILGIFSFFHHLKETGLGKRLRIKRHLQSEVDSQSVEGHVVVPPRVSRLTREDL